jgi:cytochrome c5
MRRALSSSWRWLGLGLLVLGSQAGMADDSSTPSAEMHTYPEFEDERLAVGRVIWLETCEGCHGYGIAGSPKIGDLGAWAPRLAKGKEVLYLHALDGVFGKGSTFMPPRGGNEKLTDDEVRAAVDYMVTASSGAQDPEN